MTIEEYVEAVNKLIGNIYQIEEKMFNDLNKRLEVLENRKDCTCQKQDQKPKEIELKIEWPEADIGGLHFNSQKTHGIFDLKEDGNYYSRDIMFHSARDTDDGTGRDLLSEYLDSQAVREAFFATIGNSIAQDYTLRVFLPEDNQGIKKYNGVSWWYWLRDRSSGSADYFCYVRTNGNAGNNPASAVGGCAPAFRVEVKQ